MKRILLTFDTLSTCTCKYSQLEELSKDDNVTLMQVTGLMYCGRGDGSDFWVVVDQGRGNTVYTAHFGQQVGTRGNQAHCTVSILSSAINDCTITEKALLVESSYYRFQI